jgi:hypothetical protein
VVRLYRDARAPKVKLSKEDVLFVHADSASQYALRDLMAAARKAKATVHLVSEAEVVATRTRHQTWTRQHDCPER